MNIYIVVPGDTVNSIAASYQVSPESIIYNNQLSYPYQLAVGQALLLSAEPNPEPRRLLRTNGYAYPFISPWVLEQTLPYLTELSVFSYGFTAAGDLLPPQLDDVWMVNAALNLGVLPILTLVPLGPDGRFNNYLIHSLVTNQDYISNILNQLAFTMGQKGYRGLDIDFEFILLEDRDNFTAFVQQTADFMHNLGYQVSIALAPKTSAAQQGLLYSGKDYPALGAAVDHALLMTYEWGYKYAPASARSGNAFKAKMIADSK